MTELLHDASALASWGAAIVASPWTGLDTEFFRERTYYAKLCLVQVATPDAITLVDPLHLDIRPLGAALAGPGVKILHAGRQDLELLLQETGVLPAPLFDTQIAAALAGYDEQIGYANLVAEVLKVNLAKDATRTDWAARPLSDRQLAYAQDDVRYLEALRQALLAELDRLGRVAWLTEDCASLNDPAHYDFSLTQLVRRHRQGANLPIAAQGRFQALLLWREEAARQANLPRAWVIADAVLVDLALRPPKNRADFGQRPGLDDRQIRRLGDQLISVIEAAPERPAHPWPAARLAPEDERPYQALAALVDARAQALGIGAGVIGSRRMLKEIAQGAPPQELTRGWRAEVLGTEGDRLLAEIAKRHADAA
ncbi:ribonuclease D [Acidiferrobacter sp.]|uniref:ribonuclease D n=1 Tax=Acidiferrobacter sp. TaxID=1872107 RepID=UPI0026159205|nr:ribonuclease D [Acidiferrobacter sp.]